MSNKTFGYLYFAIFENGIVKAGMSSKSPNKRVDTHARFGLAFGVNLSHSAYASIFTDDISIREKSMLMQLEKASTPVIGREWFKFENSDTAVSFAENYCKAVERSSLNDMEYQISNAKEKIQKNMKAGKHKLLTTDQAVAWAGDVKTLANELRVTVQAVHAWGEHPPIKRQRQIREMFEGKK